ncbi:fatty acid synthase [Nephila pilipes]|uniref:Fatty acid synthase n=1 Tax=Nephila pilipes TaxID=299642 RepID=A0A8X6TTW7_NEPPI|nr:fatty acid synthase [Nephila pilipes]
MKIEIAITGKSGRFPESDNVSEWSQNLYNKRNLVTESSKRWEPGIMFPSSEMQKRLLEEVYQECKLSPLKVSYVEAHGTGTIAGDPVELTAIADAFCCGREESPWVGSVKSNMGHAEPVSGLCGVLKMLISMENGVLPPNLHYYKPNPAIPALISDRIKIPTDCSPWKADYAGASSFGLGGVNAHVVLKSNGDGTKRPQNSAIPQLVLYSGRTQDSVRYLFEYLQICAKEQKIPEGLSREFFALLHKSVHSSCKLKPYRGYKLLVNDGEIAEIKHIKKLNVGDTIFLAGYSFSSTLVLEMFLQVERQPQQYPKVQDIIILDGSRLLITAYAKMYKYFDDEEEIHTLCSFVMILGAEINLAEVSLYLYALQ